MLAISFQPDFGPASIQSVVDASWMEVALLGDLMYHDCAGVDVRVCLRHTLAKCIGIRTKRRQLSYTTSVAPAARDFGTTTNLVSCADVMYTER